MTSHCQKYLQILLLAVLTCSGGNSHSQTSDLRFEVITPREGYSGNFVANIFQDSKGFMWFDTDEGITRYDGYDFKKYGYDPDNPNSFHISGFRMQEGRDGIYWMGGSNGLIRFDPKKEGFTRYKHDPDDTESISSDNISAIYVGKDGVIWVGTRFEGLNRFDPVSGKFKRFQHDPGDPLSLCHNRVTSICSDKNGYIWIGTNGGGVDRYDPLTETFRHYYDSNMDPDCSFKSKNINNLFIDHKGIIWVNTWFCLTGFNPVTEEEEVYRAPRKVSQYSEWDAIFGARTAVVDQKGKIWTGWRDGLACIDRQTKTIKRYQFDPSNPYSIVSGTILRIYEDKEGILWIGTENGMSILKPQAFHFKYLVQNTSGSNGLSSSAITSIFEDKQGGIWVGTKHAGFNRIDTSFTDVRYFLQNTNYYKSYVSTIFQDKNDNFWIGTYGGLHQLDRQSGLLKWIPDLVGPKGWIWCLFEDRNDVLWIGAAGGMSRYDRAPDQYTFFPYAPEHPSQSGNGVVTGIVENSKGEMWVGSNLYGLNRFDRQKGIYQRFLFDPEHVGLQGYNAITCLFLDSKNQIWAGTNRGLMRFDPNDETFTFYTKKDGLPDNDISCILGAGHQSLWLGTRQGLVKFTPDTKAVFHLKAEDGLLSNSITTMFKSPLSEKLFIGSNSGVTIFHPDSIHVDSFIPPVVITSFRRYNTFSESQEFIDEEGISEKKELTLSYRNNILSFKFAALSYCKTAKNQYAYKLEGLTNNWIPLGTKREVTFTHLSPGTYTLRIKGSNGDGVWNEEGASLKIIITPPWWRTWWAYLLYTLTGLGLLLGLWQYDLRRKLARAEAARLKELDTFKTRLYTNITHEFRTPLTIISGMADQILEHPQRWLIEGVGAIKRNSLQLLYLVNQMLDLQKLEAGRIPLNMVQGDILIYMKYLTESFHSQAQLKNIELRFETDLPELVVDYDPDKLQQIVSNLISNSLKFTPAGGRVLVSAGLSNGQNTPHLILKVSDTGIGIPAASQPYIFDRFYQVDDSHTRKGEGTGIGLAIIRELVKLLGGEISVKSDPGQGSEFKVVLPVTHKAPLMAGVEENELEEPASGAGTTFILRENITSNNGNLPQVLIIEDNTDVQQYLSICLENDYQLLFAGNGREGIEKATEFIPDLVISDVMMPEKDGFEVCRTLKDDIRTSHIPVILLTAKADNESRLQGLTCGADAYLAKPFNKNELLVRIQKLLELRQKLQQHYFLQGGGDGGEAVSPGGSKEEVFVEKFREIVLNHLDESHFSVDELSRELAMSRSQLYRKITALTGVSPNRYTRHLRLQKARKLLVETDDTIANIAYDTGFNDPAYFTRVFTHEFGMTPSEFRDAHEHRT